LRDAIRNRITKAGEFSIYFDHAKLEDELDYAAVISNPGSNDITLHVDMFV
jgi:hypothetical protein